MVCPLETSDKRFSWRIWEQRASGKNEEGQPTYTPEFSWTHGTRGEFVKAFQEAIGKWLPHVWRDVMQKQGLRVFEDRKSGRHSALAQCEKAYAELRLSAFKCVATTLQPPSEIEVDFFNGTALHALVRVASADALAASAAADAAAAVHAAAACTATVQSDYAAQIQTKRSHTATCARPERHNCLVTVVGYKPYHNDIDPVSPS